MEPRFKVGQKVKFKNDHDRMTGEVQEIQYSSANGFTYKIASRFYDSESNEMKDGHKLCREDELVDMTDYNGTTDPIKPDTNVDVSDQVNQEKVPEGAQA